MPRLLCVRVGGSKYSREDSRGKERQRGREAKRSKIIQAAKKHPRGKAECRVSRLLRNISWLLSINLAARYVYLLISISRVNFFPSTPPPRSLSCLKLHFVHEFRADDDSRDNSVGVQSHRDQAISVGIRSREIDVIKR